MVVYQGKSPSGGTFGGSGPLGKPRGTGFGRPPGKPDGGGKRKS